MRKAGPIFLEWGGLDVATQGTWGFGGLLPSYSKLLEYDYLGIRSVEIV